MRNFIVFLAIMGTLSGCVTIHLPEGSLPHVNYEDGVNQKEAKTIAIEYFLETNRKDLDLNNVTTRSSEEDPQYWEVHFNSWKLTKKVILVNKESGRIRD